MALKIKVTKLDCFTISTQSNVHNVVNEKRSKEHFVGVIIESRSEKTT